MSDEAMTSDAPARPAAPLDYERRRPRRRSTFRSFAVAVLSLLPALALPFWAYFVTRRLTDSAARHASLPASDVLLIALTFAAPIVFALVVCGPLAHDRSTRRR